MTRRVKILVEGQTEETFVNLLLYNYLANKGVFVTPILLTTKRVKNRNRSERQMAGRRFKGGITSYSKVKSDVRNVLNDKDAMITTMIDYYGLPQDFPGIGNLPHGSGHSKVRFLEKAFREDIDSPRFFPFFSLHEFEAFLFSESAEIATAFPDKRNLVSELTKISASFQSPEDINQGRKTHPSARITSLISGYRKRVHGPIIAQRIGLEKIRKECPHFSDWLQWLESLKNI